MRCLPSCQMCCCAGTKAAAPAVCSHSWLRYRWWSFFFVFFLQDEIRTGGSEHGRTLFGNTRTRIGQTLGIVSGHPDTLRKRWLAEAHLVAGWNSGPTCR